MILTTLNPAQIVDRIRLLPESLQLALDDIDIKNFIDEVAKAAGVSDNQIRLFEGVVSMVLIGFLRPEGLAAEFQELGVDPVTAIAAAEKIAKEVFEPVRTEIASAVLLPRDVPEPDDDAIPGPTLDLKGVAPRLAPLPPQNTGPAAGIKNEPIALPPTPANSARSAPAPKPFILQKESSAEPAVANSGFKLDLDPKLFNRAAPNSSAPMPPPHARAVELEIGNNSEGAAKPSAKMSTAPTARIVHYADVGKSLGVTAAPAIKPVPAIPPAAAPAPSRPSPFSLGVAVTPPAPSIIKNAPGVPPSIPTAPAAPARSNPPAPDPKKPPRVVNFTAEGGGTKTV